MQLHDKARACDRVLSILAPGVIQGTLPAQLDQLTAARQINFDGQGFNFQLPPSWGADGGFANLRILSIGQNRLSRSLPAEWGSSDRYRAASKLLIQLASSTL